MVGHVNRVGSIFHRKSITVVGLIAGGQGGGQGRQTCFFTPVEPLRTNKEKIHHMIQGNHDRCRTEPSGRCTKMYFVACSENAQDKGLVFGRTISDAISNVTISQRCSASCFFFLVKVVQRKSNEILHHKTQPLPQAPKVVLRRVWQVQQGRPPQELQRRGEECRERLIARIEQAIVSHSDKSRLFAALEEGSNNQQTPSSEQSKEMIHPSGHVESIELCQLSVLIEWCTQREEI